MGPYLSSSVGSVGAKMLRKTGIDSNHSRHSPFLNTTVAQRVRILAWSEKSLSWLCMLARPSVHPPSLQEESSLSRPSGYEEADNLRRSQRNA